MKLIFSLLILMVSLNVLQAQPTKEVEAAVERLRLAMVDPTAEALANITSKDLSYGHSAGLIENQSQFMEALVSGKSDFKSITFSDQTITMSGKNVAVVRHKLQGESLGAGTYSNINLGILTVWVKEKGGWKLLARQAFRL